MASVRVENDQLQVELKGWDMVWALHGSFTILLANIARASTAKPPAFWSSMKLLGTAAPGLKMAGTALYHGEVIFIDYRGNEDQVLVIDCTGGTYKHVFVHVDDPERDATSINAALAAQAPGLR